MGMPVNVPAPVKQFVLACHANARKVWSEPDDKSFIEGLLYVHEESPRRWEVSDNFERFFSTIYVYVEADNAWYTRRMYGGGMISKPVPHTSVMAGADIMYTG